MNTQDDYSILKEYTESMFNRNLRDLNGNYFTVIDFLHEAYATGFSEISEAKLIIRNEIIIAKRKTIAKIQRTDNSFNIFYKVCKICQQPKSASEFKPLLDKRTQFRYYSPNCILCQHDINTSDEYRKKRRERYASSDISKHKAHIRYLRYKSKQKKCA